MKKGKSKQRVNKNNKNKERILDKWTRKQLEKQVNEKKKEENVEKEEKT